MTALNKIPSGMLKVLLFLWNRTTSFVLSLFALRTLIRPIFVDLPVKGIRSVNARIRSLKWPKSFTRRELLTFLRKCFVIIVAPLHSFKNVNDFAIAILYVVAPATLLLAIVNSTAATFWFWSTVGIGISSLVVQFFRQNLQINITTHKRNKLGLIIRGILHGGIFLLAAIPGIYLVYQVNIVFDYGIELTEITVNSASSGAQNELDDARTEFTETPRSWPLNNWLEDIDSAYTDVLKSTSVALGNFSVFIRIVFSGVYAILKFVTVISWCVVAAILSKAFIFLFLRSLLRDGVEIRFTFVAKETAKRKMASVKSKGPEIKIKFDDKFHLYNKKGEVELDVQSLRVSAIGLNYLPDKGCRIARLRNNLFFVKSWEQKEQTDRIKPVRMSASEGRHLVQVCLNAGEQICVSLNHLIAFNDTIRFESLVDLKVTSWLVDHPVQYLANGPGLLVFLVAGEPRIWRDGSEAKGKELETGRLVCWPADLEFSTDRIRSITDMYFGTPRVILHKDHGSSPIILDYDQGGMQSSGVWRALTRLYRPW